MSSRRLLLRFSKEGQARFLSHLDLMRLFERAFRRAELPVRMTQGFNPHPKIAILLALPVGVEADEEPLEVEFEPPVPPEDALDRLGAQLPEGIRLVSARTLPEGVRARVESLVYRVDVAPDDALETADVEGFLARDAIEVERSTRSGSRTIDLRAPLEAMGLDGRCLTFRLRVDPSGTPRPTEVADALLGRSTAGDPAIRVRRTEVRLAIPGPEDENEPPRATMPRAT
jgi:radical SAM-linked protein